MIAKLAVTDSTRCAVGVILYHTYVKLERYCVAVDETYGDCRAGLRHRVALRPRLIGRPPLMGARRKFSKREQTTNT